MSWNHTGCVCGPPDSVAVMNRSMSFYIARDVPTGEIDQIIGWLGSIRDDCAYKISQLEKLKQERDRTERWRRNINDLARQFFDPDSLHLDLETRQKIIQQRLGCEWHIALNIAEQVATWAKKQRRKKRDAEICLKSDAGAKPGALAKEYGLTRQQVHNILKDRPDRKFLK